MKTLQNFYPVYIQHDFFVHLIHQIKIWFSVMTSMHTCLGVFEFVTDVTVLGIEVYYYIASLIVKNRLWMIVLEFNEN